MTVAGWTERPLRILQVGAVEHGGGAAAVASSLLRGFRSRGMESWLAVGRQTTDDPGVFTIPDDDRLLCRMTGYALLQARLRRMAGRSPGRGWGQLSRSLRFATHARALLNSYAGLEDFEFAGTGRLLELTPEPPDILHCHNLHGGCFDLRAIAQLSQRVPTILTLHDAWLLSGHCAHSFDCERWKIGCGACPDLTIAPAVRRDRTAENWARKRDIYQRSRLYVATPARWLLDKVEQSMLAPAVRSARVIPNGVDLSVFRPVDKRRVREALGIPADSFVALLVTGVGEDSWRDRQMVGTTLGLLSARPSTRDVRFIAVGRASPVLGGPGVAGDANNVIRFDGYQADPSTMARYYQSADVYLHLARADTFPMAVLEALACGTPVVATRVGGIHEQICHADVSALRASAFDRLGHATGVLVPAGDARMASQAVVALLESGEVGAALGRNAVSDVRRRFDLNQQIDCYLGWYRAIIEDWIRHAVPDHQGNPARASGENGLAVD